MQWFFALTEDSTAFRELEKQLARKFSKYQEARRLDRGLISASSWDRISAVFQSSFSMFCQMRAPLQFTISAAGGGCLLL